MPVNQDAWIWLDLVRSAQGTSADATKIVALADALLAAYKSRYPSCCNGPPADRPITDLQFSVRARKALARAGIKTVTELAATPEIKFHRQRNCGFVTIDEFVTRMAEIGITWPQKTKENQNGAD